jgi:hypothetical protein
MNAYMDDEENANIDTRRKLDIIEILLRKLDKTPPSNYNDNTLYLKKGNNNLNTKEYDILTDSSSNNQFKALDGNTNGRLENPFFVDYKKNGLNRLFSNGDKSRLNIEDDFSTDTPVSAFGGLSLWQFTAIIIFVLILIGVLVCLLKKANECSKNMSRSNSLKHSHLKRTFSRTVKLSSFLSKDNSNTNANNLSNISTNTNANNTSMIHSSRSTNTTATTSSNLMSNSILFNNHYNVCAKIGPGSGSGGLLQHQEHHRSLPNIL